MTLWRKMIHSFTVQVIGYGLVLYGTLFHHLFEFNMTSIKILVPLYFIVIIIFLPAILIVKAITMNKKYRVSGSISIFFIFFLIFLPLTHVFLFETHLLGQGYIDLISFVIAGKIAFILSILGGIFGLIANLVYIFLFNIRHKI